MPRATRTNSSSAVRKYRLGIRTASQTLAVGVVATAAAAAAPRGQKDFCSGRGRMKREHHESLCGYRFYVPDDANTLKPFLKEDDRRIASIQRVCHSRIYLTRETSIRKGQKKRAVLVRARTRRELELCLRRIDDTFAHLYACSNLNDATAAVHMVQLRKYHTNEDLSLSLASTNIVYYQLSFSLDSSDMVRYERWRKTSDALLIKNLGCILVVSMKDTPGAGFLRRYSLISGECRKNVVDSYKVFRATFAYLPEFEDENDV